MTYPLVIVMATTGVSNPGDLGELFSVCDLDGSGFIDETELATFCKDLSPDDVSDIFRELDKDGDGRISIGEFSEGFKEFTGHLGALCRQKSISREERGRLKSQDSLDGTARLPEFLGTVEDGLTLLTW